MTTLDKSILKRLANSYEAYEHFPFVERFDQFKSKKRYFLEGMNDEEVMNLYHEFVFYQFAYWNHLVPKLSKSELLAYYYKRKND